MRLYIFTWLWLTPLLSFGQVGIGTSTPNPKAVLDLNSTTQGLLVPRMTGLQRAGLQLTSGDAGMMVYQMEGPQDPPITPVGLYYFDGSQWQVPIANGSQNGQTLRWDGIKWVSTSNLFNQGNSIGIGTLNPNTQLHIHSISIPTTRIQLTNTTTGSQQSDGLMLGVSLANGSAHLLQNETKSLWFGTSGIERMRVDSIGRLGIGLPNPQARLDVNGTVRLGTAGTVLNGIIKRSIEVQIPAISSMGEDMIIVPFEDAMETASVYVSPASSLAGLMIGYARVNAPDSLEIKIMNMGADMDEPETVMLYISLIQ